MIHFVLYFYLGGKLRTNLLEDQNLKNKTKEKKYVGDKFFPNEN